MRMDEIAATVANRRLVRLWAIKNAESVVDNIDDRSNRHIAKAAIIAAKRFLGGDGDEDAMLAAGRLALSRAFDMEAGYGCQKFPAGGMPQISAALAAAAAAGTDSEINHAGGHAGNSVFNVAFDQTEFDLFHAAQLAEISALANNGG